MKAAVQSPVRQDDRHIGEAQMIAFYEKRLEMAERETVRIHLTTCAECLSLYREVSDFFDPPRENEEPISESEIAQGWHSLWAQIENERSVENEVPEKEVLPFPPTNRNSRNRLWRPIWAMAAGLLISFGGIGVQTWRLAQERQANQDVAIRLQSTQQELSRLSDSLQQRNNELAKEQANSRSAEAQIAELQAKPSESSSVGINIPINQILLAAGRGENDEQVLELSAKSPIALLQLAISNPKDFPAYTIEIFDQQQRKVPVPSGLVPMGSDNTLNLTLNRAAVKPGKYQLSLYGQRGQTRTKLGEYKLAVKMVR